MDDSVGKIICLTLRHVGFRPDALDHVKALSESSLKHVRVPATHAGRAHANAAH
jgi:hypothetical protein